MYVFYFYQQFSTFTIAEPGGVNMNSTGFAGMQATLHCVLNIIQQPVC
jgi:hypothetical protein